MESAHGRALALLFDRYGWVPAVVCALVLWAPGIGTGSIVNGDDAIYAGVLRAIVEGAPVADALAWRPPLFYALSVACLKLVGVSELGLRLPSLLCGLAAVWASWRAARALLPERPFVAANAALLLVGTAQFFLFARQVRGLDLLLAALFAVTIEAAARAGDRRRAWAGVGMLLGLAIWTKSVVVVTIGPAVAVLWWARGGSLRRRGEAAGLVALVAAAFAGAWLLWMRSASGGANVQDHVQNHVARRASDATLVAATDTGPAYYVESLATLEGLFGLASLAALAFVALRAARRDLSAAVVVAWVLGVLVPFSLVSTKLPHYALPAYPALAIALAWSLDAAAQRARRPSASLLAGGVLTAACIASSPVGFASGWGQADYSPHLEAAAARTDALAGQGATLAVWNEYHVAAAFYHRGPTLLWTDDPGFLSAYGSTHGFVRGQHFEHVEWSELVSRLRAAAPACVVVRDGRERSPIPDQPGGGVTVERLPGANLVCVAGPR